MRSVEILLHLNCGACGKWWSIGDADISRAYFCPWCGVKETDKDRLIISSVKAEYTGTSSGEARK